MTLWCGSASEEGLTTFMQLLLRMRHLNGRSGLAQGRLPSKAWRLRGPPPILQTGGSVSSDPPKWFGGSCGCGQKPPNQCLTLKDPRSAEHRNTGAEMVNNTSWNKSFPLPSTVGSFLFPTQETILVTLMCFIICVNFQS